MEGDYGKVGSLLSWMGESLVQQLDVHSGERVLDVAAGNGNASLPAARRFADVLATDYVPELLAEAERRADADGVVLRTQVADAQSLPFGEREFDVVMSTIGAMFAPDQQAVAAEMLRVCRSGGPVVAAFTAVGEAGREDLEAELRSVFEGRNTADDGTLAMDVTYLEVVGVKK